MKKQKIKQIFKNPELYYHLINKSKKKIKTDVLYFLETLAGTKICVRDNVYDIRIIKEQFVDRQYFPSDVFLNFSPKVVIDIGGYIGDFSIYCAENFETKVHCYEPTPQNFNILQKNIKNNKNLQEKIFIFNQGISDEDKFILLNVQDLEGEIHASSKKNYLEEQKINIPVISLENAISKMNEPIDLLKIDTEGTEFDILENHQKIKLSKKINYLVFEHHPFVTDYSFQMDNLVNNLRKNFQILKKTKSLIFLQSMDFGK